MVIVEGPDGAGKSTLVNLLKMRFGLVLGARGTADRDLLYTVTRQDTYTALSEAVKGSIVPRIWDRLYYSELVYADVVGRPVEFSTSEQGWIQRMLDALHCPRIVCLPDFPVVEENALAVNQMDGVNENLVSIYNRYVELCATGPLSENTLIYDYVADNHGEVDYVQDRGPYQLTFTTLKGIVHEVDDYLEEREDRTWSL